MIEQLGRHYYRVRSGIGFNKTPTEYGAFPTDPYSHTPGHMGAQQPGMTGQVKEEIVARFGELGIRVKDGAVAFDPALLRACEFVDSERPFRYLDVSGTWCEIPVARQSLAFTWCQVPLIYRLDDSADATLSVLQDDGEENVLPALSLPPEIAAEIFQRTGRIRQISLVLNKDQLLSG